MLDDIIAEILQVGHYEIAELLKVVVNRYRELFPDWDISIISCYKAANRNEQLDNMIALLEGMKETR